MPETWLKQDIVAVVGKKMDILQHALNRKTIWCLRESEKLMCFSCTLTDIGWAAEKASIWPVNPIHAKRSLGNTALPSMRMETSWVNQNRTLVSGSNTSYIVLAVINHPRCLCEEYLCVLPLSFCSYSLMTSLLVGRHVLAVRTWAW